MKKNKLDREELDLLRSVEDDEWVSVKNLGFEKKKYSLIAQNTSKMRKNKRISIRVSSSVLAGIKKESLHEGIPYQTLISSILYKYLISKNTVHAH